ncbi:hypothetical protein SERLA73DRAFT_68384 [Serpula lacrymans var. lacrymans S7.3]|uniref:Uncharacterized protein n=1 Tax=Serpula lacrymans var. lacrymans (strain S7.3) TaxID=936435 RepID=F8PFE5_SERL3|nr:hypothetical protein SERLA73DRAFT_68384 [Serpula lacrymans var. lacrymans S7.3]
MIVVLVLLGSDTSDPDLNCIKGVHGNGIKDDNKGVTLIDQSRVANVRIGQDSNLLEIFKKDISSEEKVRLDGNENYLWEDGLFYFKDKIYVPESARIKAIDR